MNCPECSTEFTPRVKTQKFCTPKCRVTDERRRRKEERDAKRKSGRACKTCGTLFWPSKCVPGQIYCKPTCKQAAYRKLGKSHKATVVATLADDPWQDVRWPGMAQETLSSFYVFPGPERISSSSASTGTV